MGSGALGKLSEAVFFCMCVCVRVLLRVEKVATIADGRQTVHIGRAEIFAVIIISSTSFIS